MRAVVWTRYGPPEVLSVQEVREPEPKNDEMLVRVEAANVFPGDCELRRFDVAFPFSLFVRLYCGVFKPRAGARLGQEYAGEVVSVGKDVAHFRPGDRVFGAVEMLVRGSYAEYLTTSGRTSTTIPDNVSFEAAAVATVGGLNALHFLKVAEVSPDAPPKDVLMLGAGGSIGTMAIQIAKAFGARVTAVDTTHKLDKLLELGADEVVDFTRTDFSASAHTYDAVIDIVGKNTPASSLARSLKVVRPGGLLVLGNPPFRHLLARPWAGRRGGKRIRFALAGYERGPLETLRELLASDSVKPVIDRRYALTDVVAAHRFVETGQRIGNVVLCVGARPVAGSGADGGQVERSR